LQVGVGGIVVFYTLSGAAVFQHLETLTEDPSLAKASITRSQTLEKLWTDTNVLNKFDEPMWKARANDTLLRHQTQLVSLVRGAGYDGRTNRDKWSFSASLMFALRQDPPLPDGGRMANFEQL
jgi:hypothetical protein